VVAQLAAVTLAEPMAVVAMHEAEAAYQIALPTVPLLAT
jgi:hypothetical protein